MASRQPPATVLGASSCRSETRTGPIRGDRLGADAVELETGETADELGRVDSVDHRHQHRTGRHVDEVAPGAQALGGPDPALDVGLGGAVDERAVGDRERVQQRGAPGAPGGRIEISSR